MAMYFVGIYLFFLLYFSCSVSDVFWYVTDGGLVLVSPAILLVLVSPAISFSRNTTDAQL